MRGVGWGRDILRARSPPPRVPPTRYLQKAADKGTCADALYSLAGLYDGGDFEVLGKDEGKAGELMEKAAAMKHAQAIQWVRRYKKK